MVQLTPSGVSLGLRKPKAGPERGSRVGRSSEVVPMQMSLVGANPKPEISGVGELRGRSNYFIGNDPKNWKTNVPHFSAVQYADIYRGIHMLYYGNQKQLEYDFIVSAGADPNQITIRFDGIDSEEVEADGHLVLHIGDSQMKLQTTIYQDVNGNRQAVLGGYTIKGNHQVGFQIGDYDKKEALVIDPVLLYSTFLGGDSDDRGNAIALDGSGNIYLTGYTISSNFPTANALQPNLHNTLCHPSVSPRTETCHDAFITKLDSSGSFLIYSTYFGGTGWDDAFGIAADPSGNAYVTGTTFSSDFPTVNAVQPTFKGADSSVQVVTGDAFVAKLDPTGSRLVYSTYLGSAPSTSNGRDAGLAIVADASGNAYVTGFAGDGFPLLNPIQSTYGDSGAGGDVFVTKLSPAGALVFSTYLGGNGQDRGATIVIDTSGNVYVAGITSSTNYPTINPLFTDGAAFLTKLNAAGSAIVYSTRIHGTGGATGIATDSVGDAYITGSTSAVDFPTLNAFQPAFGGGTCSGFPCSDAFVMKLNPTGSAVLYSTYLGGNNNDGAADIAVDGSGNAYIVGQTFSTNFPTRDALQASLGGIGDGFLSKLDASGALVYSTYIGGSDAIGSSTNNPDSVNGVALDGKGNAYIVGSTASSNFPTANPFQATDGGFYDVFIAKIADASPADAGFTAQDIGSIGSAGSTSFLNGTFTVDASGTDIWNNADAFRFVYQSFSGDGEIVAHVVSLRNTDPWAKAGVMIRETLAAGSKHAMMGITPGNGTTFPFRLQTDGPSASQTPFDGLTAPYWVRLVRSGSTFTGYKSSDGVTWVQIGSQTVTMAANVFIGLAVTAHNNSAITRAVFDNVSVKAAGSPPPPPPPQNLADADIGTVGVAGSDSFSNGTFTIQASGGDIWGTVDSFHYTYQSLSGDGEIKAHLVSLQNTDTWAKAGVMIRETLNADSKHALMAITGGNGAAFQRRTATGGQSVHTGGPLVTAPYWVRLVRSGNTLTGFVSTDGVSWTQVGSDTITMASGVFIGLAVTSHNNGVLTRAVFDNVTIAGGSAPPPPPPQNTADADIGTVGVAGTDSFSNGTFTIRASGSDIWGAADSFHYTYQSLTGDGDIVAHLVSLQNTDTWAKAGVMIRETLNADSKHALMAITGGNGAAFQRRLATGGQSFHTGGPFVAAPYWVKLVRSGNTFTGFVSTDGVNWAQVGSDTIAMGATVFIGLAVTSHNNNVLTTAVFDNVSLAAGSSPPPPPPPVASAGQDIGAVGVAGTDSDSNGTFTIQASGSDIWGTADAFHFLSEPLTGDGTVIARLDSLQNTDAWAKAGVMIRESLSADSKHAFMAITAANGAAFQRRQATGGQSVNTFGPLVGAPYWVRLVRSGNTFTGYVSTDGINWTLVGSDTISMTANVFVGLAVTSHNNNVLTTAVFDNVDTPSAMNLASQ
jgi:regulation of enolase protein 1 (concanavalin A-like superfamily)